MNLYIRFVQYVETTRNQNHVPWRIIYDNFLMFVVQGTILLKYNQQEIEIGENELCIIPPFMRHRMEITSCSCCYYGVHFDFFYDDSEAFNEDVYLGYESQTCLELPVDEKLSHRTFYHPENVQFPAKMRIHQHETLEEYLKKLLFQFHEKEFGHELLVKSTFYEIIHLIIHQIITTEQSQEANKFPDILRYMENLAQDYNRQLDVAQLALEFGMSPKRFRSYFKKLTSKTPKEYLIESKMERAKELLSTGNYQVGEVAYMLGYDDIFYFSKLFKRKTGHSPREFLGQKP